MTAVTKYVTPKTISAIPPTGRLCSQSLMFSSLELLAAFRSHSAGGTQPVVIREAEYFFAFHSDTVAQQSRNWQGRFRRMNNLRPCSVVPTRCWNRPRLPLLARNGHGAMSDLSSLCAAKRTSGRAVTKSAFDRYCCKSRLSQAAKRDSVVLTRF